MYSTRAEIFAITKVHTDIIGLLMAMWHYVGKVYDYKSLKVTAYPWKALCSKGINRGPRGP